MSDTTSDCFNFLKQEFLVCATIHKARNLYIFNADTYVKVSFDKKSKSTKVFQNSENPYFNEYFVFETFCNLNELLRLTILFQVFQRNRFRKDKNLGQFFIDLATVWTQRGHTFFKKWGKLESPLGEPDNKFRGYLQIDLSIVSKNDPPAPAVFEALDYEDVEKNLLRPYSEKCEVENVRHHVTIYKGMFLKKADYIVQISFAGFHGKTKIAKGCTHPEWNEQFSFSWVFPSLCRTFLIQVMANEFLQWKCVSYCEMYFDDITFPGSLPAFGPSFLHLYDSIETSNYIGRIMMSIKTEKLQKHLSPARCIVARKTNPLSESSFWTIENFVVAALIWGGDFLHVNSSNIKLGLKCGEWCSNLLEAFLRGYSDSPDCKHFRQETPQRIIRLSGFFPDTRLKYEADLVLKDIVRTMRTQLRKYKLFETKHDGNQAIHAKYLRSIIVSFKEQVINARNNIQYAGFKQLSDWDEHRTGYIRDYLEALASSFEHFRKILKSSRRNYFVNIRHIYSDLALIMKEMKGILAHRLQDLWPDLTLQVTSNGVPIATCQVNPIDYVFSTRICCTGRQSGSRQNFVLKPINCQHTCRDCGCIAGKIDGWIWIGTEAEYQLHCKPTGWTLKEPMFYEIVEEFSCTAKIHIHQAKIRPGNEKITGECSAHARLTFLEYVQTTKNVCHSLSPVWNQVVIFESIKLPGSYHLYEESPIFAAIEIFCMDAKQNPYYLGCGLIKLSVRMHENEKEDNKVLQNVEKASAPSDVRIGMENTAFTKLNSVSPPPLKWVPVSKEGAVAAEVLISGELVEANELYEEEPVSVTSQLPQEICLINRIYKIEVIFVGFRNLKKTTFKPQIAKHRMRLIFGDLCLTSGPSHPKFGEGVNFEDIYALGLVNLPEQHEYWPPILLTHIKCTKDKKDLNIGVAMISNSHKYLMKNAGICSGQKIATFQNNSEQTDVETLNFAYLEMETSFLSESYAETTPLLKKGYSPSESQVPGSRRWFWFPNIFGKITGQAKATKNELARKLNEEDEFSWWTKFYNSVEKAEGHCAGIDSQKHNLVIYGSELENQIEFNFLQDWAEPFPLIHGIQRKRNLPPKEESYCNVKCHIEIRKCNTLLSPRETNERLMKNARNSRYQEISALVNPIEVVVRVYVVQGLRIRSQDRYSESDAYVKVQFGESVISDRANYIPNQTNPVFGKVFQLEGVIPREHILHISVFDRDLIDDLIGCTSIDLEDRFRTKHRACVGLAEEFSEKGYNVWRDLKSPFDILNEIAIKHDLDAPEITGEQIKFAGKIFKDSTKISIDERIENRLCLTVLKNLDRIPEVGYKIVPEHVETRSLYRSNRPGIEQGKLQLWVEVYERDNVPPPIDISPIPPRKYELRVIIYNTSGVILDEKNIFGKKMSDIYLKGTIGNFQYQASSMFNHPLNCNRLFLLHKTESWLDDISTAQYTDVHYRSLNGEGNFNWRMIFPLRYSRIEDMMVVTRKAAIYEQFDTEIKVPALFYLQIWDNDVFSADDFLGVININLSHFEEPSITARKCSIKGHGKFVNLFRVGVVRGWFPARGKLANGTIGLTGKVEMLLQILSEAEASARPAGLGRGPPDSLPEPKRPETSFNWYTNPLLSLRYIIVPQIKKLICCLCIAIVVIILIIAFVYSLPGNIIKKTTNIFPIN